jgi:hypothetical protein
MKWVGRLVLAVIAAFIAYVICFVLVTFLPDINGVGPQAADIIATFTKAIVVIVFLFFLFFGYKLGPFTRFGLL